MRTYSLKEALRRLEKEPTAVFSCCIDQHNEIILRYHQTDLYYEEPCLLFCRDDIIHTVKTKDEFDEQDYNLEFIKEV